jgi:predicted nucleotide-binding protein
MFRDEIAPSTPVTARSVKHLLETDLVIADLSNLNPNVMYELGIRHAVGKPVVIFADPTQRLPFDISTLRVILVDALDLDSVTKARHLLRDALVAAEAASAYVGSPVEAAVDLALLQNSRRNEIAADPTEATGAVIDALKSFEARIASLETMLESRPDGRSAPSYSRRVFIVHGREDGLKNELARVLERLDFHPVILHEQPDRGQTIFAKLNLEMADIGYAFVLLTPDDVGSLNVPAPDLQHRARQNVVFEHGMFAAHLGPNRVCALRRGEVEMPSDLHGVIYKTIPDTGIQGVALEIANELKAAGYSVDVNKLLTA